MLALTALLGIAALGLVIMLVITATESLDTQWHEDCQRAQQEVSEGHG